MIKILLAEDDRDDLYFFKAALEDLPQAFELRHAKNGNALFELLEEAIPDFLFLDILMPYGNGLTVMKEIRKNKLYDNLPIIILTSNNSDQYVESFYLNSANLYLLKQYSVKALTTKLNYIFSIDWKNLTYYPSKSKFLVE